jgi:uncharacterized protein HemY
MQTISKIILLFLVVAIFVALGSYGTGHVIIFVAGYRIDLALSSLIIGLVILFVAVYYLIRVFGGIVQLPVRLRKLRQAKRTLQSHRLLNQSLINYFSGYFNDSVVQALAALKKDSGADIKSVALLVAYKASDKLADSQTQQQILHQLNAIDDKHVQLAKNIALTKSNYRLRLYAKAIQNLNLVLLHDKKNILAHYLQLKLYIKLKNYDKAFEMLSWLDTNRHFDATQLLTYKLEVLSNLFCSVGDYAELQYFYKKLPSEDKQNAQIQQFYLAALLRLNQFDILLNTLAKLELVTMPIAELILNLATKLSTDNELLRLVDILERLKPGLVTNYLYYQSLGICKYRLNNYIEARSNFEESMLLNNSQDGLLYLLLVARSMNDDVLFNNILLMIEGYIKNEKRQLYSQIKKGD